MFGGRPDSATADKLRPGLFGRSLELANNIGAASFTGSRRCGLGRQRVEEGRIVRPLAKLLQQRLHDVDRRKRH